MAGQAGGMENDKLFLPEDATDLSLLPVNVPTGGWEQLNPANATAVQVPGTVEEYCTVSSRPSPDDGAGVSWWFRTIKLPATLKGRRVLIHLNRSVCVPRFIWTGSWWDMI